MHNYIVPSKYHHKTRIGNWSEEWELEETKFISINIINILKYIVAQNIIEIFLHFISNKLNLNHFFKE